MLFAALVPSLDAIEDLDEFLEPRRAAAPFRLVPPEQWHLTLAFMADVVEWRVGDPGGRVAGLAAGLPPVGGALEGRGAFPDWSGCQGVRGGGRGGVTGEHHEARR